MRYLHKIFQQETLRLTTAFSFNHTLKSRIMMLNQPQSTHLARLKFGFVLPILAICLLIVGACSKEKFSELNPLNVENVKLPDAFRELRTLNINSQSPKTFKYIFSKDVEYWVAFYQKDNSQKLPLEINLYEIDEKTQQSTLVKSVKNKQNAGGSFYFKPTKSAVYQLELLPQSDKQAFMVSLAYNRGEDYHKIADQNFGRASMQYRLSEEYNKKIYDMPLRLGFNYIFVIGDEDGKPFEINEQDLPQMTLLNEDNQLIATNFAKNKKYPAMAYKPNQESSLKFKYEFTKKFENMHISVYEKPIE
jgi:hypothetical protein